MHLVAASRPVIAFALVTLVHAVLVGLSLAISRHGQGPAAFLWPASGFAIAATLVLGRRMALAAGLGAAVELLFGMPLLGVGFDACGTACEALVGAEMLRRAGVRAPLERMRGIVVLTLGAALLAPAVSASIGTLGFMVAGTLPSGQALADWRTWYLGNMVGVFAVAPAVTLVLTGASLVPRGRRPEVSGRWAVAVAAAAAALVGVAWISFTGAAATHYFLFPLVIWLAMRLPPWGAAFAAATVTAVAYAALALGRLVDFEGVGITSDVFGFQIFLVVLMLTGYVLSAQKLERDAAAAALVRSEARLHAALHSLPLDVAFFDDEGRCDYQNEWSRENFGEIQGKLAPEVAGAASPDVAAAWLAVFEQAQRGEVVVKEMPHMAKNGPRVATSILAPILVDGATHGIAIAAVDVTEQRRAEAALRERENHYRALAETIPAIVFTLDAGAAVDYLNQRWFDFTGTAPRAARDVDCSACIHPDDLAAVRAAQGELATRSAAGSMEMRLLQHDGAYHWFHCSVSPLLTDGGRVTKWIGVASDVQDFKDLEATLRAADRSKDEFLAMLAHELRNPLAPLASCLELLRARASAAGGDSAFALETMDRQVRVIRRLVDDLLDVSRVTRGKIRLRRELVTLQQVLRDAVDTARPQAQARGQTLTASLTPSREAWLHADVTRLAQVFDNLLANAVKYTPEGGRIEVRAALTGHTAVVEIEDDGLGLAEDLAPRVFEPFVQGERALDRSQGGLGIGLTLVRALVQMHGGSVEARSEGPGRGSVFTVRLPATPRTQLDLGAPAPGTVVLDKGRAGAVQACARRVLVVDDNVDAALSTALLLRSRGYDVEVANDPEAGLMLATALHPDVVLLDIGLPRIDGYEMARRLRSDPTLADLKLVALTGYGRPEDLRRAHAAGFDAHLLKPAETAALMQAVEVTKSFPLA